MRSRSESVHSRASVLRLRIPSPHNTLIMSYNRRSTPISSIPASMLAFFAILEGFEAGRMGFGAMHEVEFAENERCDVLLIKRGTTRFEIEE